MKSENNLQGDSSFKGLQSLSTLFLVSSLAQIAQHQLTVLSRLGVHVCITFCVAFNMNNIYIAQATFFVAVSAYIQHCIKKCVPFCDFGPPAATSWRRPWRQQENNTDHASQSLSLLLARATYIMVQMFTHIPYVVNHTINATPPERLQQYETNVSYVLGGGKCVAWSISLSVLSRGCGQKFCTSS